MVLRKMMHGRAAALMIAGLMTVGSAQQAGAQAAPKSAVPAYFEVISRLGAIGKLPDGTWKVHAGDLPHGEALTLDDSTWSGLAAWKSSQAAAFEGVWYRQTYIMPKTLGGYDTAGARVWFHFSGQRQIVYFNGRRVALGEDLEPIVLFENAKPGDTVVVAVKVLPDPRNDGFKAATLRVEFPNVHPAPDDIRREFQSAVQLIPSFAPDDPSKMEILNDAAKAIDLAALTAHDQARFDSSLKVAQAKLETLKPVLDQAVFHVVGQSHMDAAWLWPWTETVDVVRRTFASSLQLMYEYPNYTYSQSAAQYYEWMAQKYPEMNAEIARRIKEGRWEVVGGMWVEPDLNMPDGESLVRQLLVGKRLFKQAYGADVRIGWNPDSFGYTLQLPQIYKKSGVDYFVTTKMTWNDTNHLPFSLFWWQSPDGSKVLTYFPLMFNEDLDPSRLSNDLAIERKRATGATELMDLYGVGDHGGGPTRVSIDQGLRNSDPSLLMPKYEFGTAQSYFDKIEPQIAADSPSWNYASMAKGYTPPPAEAGKVVIPTWTSDLYLEYHRGVFTGQANQKRNNRDAEVEMLNAEKWSSLAWVGGKPYPASELTEDWKKVLFNQFHDLLPGSGIAPIYKDAQKDYDLVRLSTNEITTRAQADLTAQIDTRAKAPAGSVPVVVFNPLGWTRSGEVVVKLQLPSAAPTTGRLEVLDPSGRPAPIGAEVMSSDAATGEVTVRLHAENVPALGYKVFHVLARAARPLAKPEVALSATDAAYTLEDGALRVVIDKATGCISELFDKRTGLESLAKGGCGNQLQAFKNLPREYDAWNIDPGTYDVAPTVIDKVDAIASQNFAGHPAIRINRTWQSSTFVQTIMLDTTTEAVTVDNDVDWHESHVLLKAAFPVAGTSPFATFEVPYGTIQRPTTRNNSWEKAQFEVPALRWGDLGDASHGLSVINNSKYGYDAVGNQLRLTLLRSPKSPDPNADMGHQHFRYAIYPHGGDWKAAMTVRRGYEFNYSLSAVAVTPHPGPLPAEHGFASAETDNVVLTAMKKAESSNSLIFRGYEWAGKAGTLELHVPPGATSATVTNMQETPEGSALSVTDGVVKAPIHPYEILTLRVDYPNSGAPAVHQDPGVMAYEIDETHDAARTSWVPGADGHEAFPIQNLPLGVFSVDGGAARGGVRIGDHVLDLSQLAASGLLDGAALKAAGAASGPTLNPLLALSAEPRRTLRRRVSALLSDGAHRATVEPMLTAIERCVMHLPAAIGDYTDFYVGIHHAMNIGRQLRPDNPLLPNYKHVPIGYHGRASSVRPSGEVVRRPSGQTKAPDAEAPSFGPCKRLDYELEMGVWIGPGNALGEPTPISRADAQIAGLCLLNDWSARDMQAWEYQPLGPFLAKSFLTSVSPWIVTAEALAPFRITQPPRPDGDPKPLPYLWDDVDQAHGAYAITLEVAITSAKMRQAGMAPHRLSVGPASNMYWTAAQMVAHHSSNGCDLRPGDLLGTGTISTPGEEGRGSLMEITRSGQAPITLPTGETRGFLEEGDEVIFNGRATAADYTPIGFGECRGIVGTTR